MLFKEEIKMSDNETPEGLRILYDLLVKASEFPGDSMHNPKNLLLWSQKLKSLHSLLSAYQDEEYKKGYMVIKKRMVEI
jgi:hypothetical protein